MSEAIPASAEVIVFGGDAVVGRALEMLLWSADCSVRFLGEASLSEPGLLDRLQLIILAPGVSDRCRAAIRARIGDETAEARVSVLELLSGSQEAQAGTRYVLPWPCRAEELKRQIKKLLTAQSLESKDSRNLQTAQEERRIVDDKGGD